MRPLTQYLQRSSLSANLTTAFAGVLLGQKLRRHINEDAFRRALAVVLFLIGLNLIRKALM